EGVERGGSRGDAGLPICPAESLFPHDLATPRHRDGQGGERLRHEPLADELPDLVELASRRAGHRTPWFVPLAWGSPRAGARPEIGIHRRADLPEELLDALALATSAPALPAAR